MLCWSLFFLFYFFFWPLCCLFFFDMRILIASLWYLQTLRTQDKEKLNKNIMFVSLNSTTTAAANGVGTSNSSRHMKSPPVSRWLHVAQFLDLCMVIFFHRCLLIYPYLWSLYCLFLRFMVSGYLFCIFKFYHTNSQNTSET